MLIIWADPRPYIATIFTANMLSKQGFSVDLIYRKSNISQQIKGDIECDINTKLHPIVSESNDWKDKINYLYLAIKVVILSWRERPDVVIGYNKMGLLVASILKKIYPNTKLIYHNYDYDHSDFTDQSERSWLSKFLSRLELKMARNADLTIFPSNARGEKYKELANLSKDPLTVMNCYPLRWNTQKTGELKEVLSNNNLSFDKLVVRLGMIGPFHAIETSIRSVLEWKGNFGLILAGFCPDREYLNKIRQLVNELKLGDRVVILPSVSNSLWYDCLLSADLGLALYEPWNLSHAHMAGTSQKLNGYFVAGIPSLVPNTVEFIEFVQRYKTSKVVDVNNPSSIAQGVNSLLSDNSEYEIYQHNVNKAFKSEFNFNKQFSSTLEWIKN
jgi:glycosyltransferase involved in cell wall biosynthesis